MHVTEIKLLSRCFSHTNNQVFVRSSIIVYVRKRKKKYFCDCKYCIQCLPLNNNKALHHECYQVEPIKHVKHNQMDTNSFRS